IMQLLTIAIPKLEELAREGEEGQKKINKYTRITAVILALIQAVGYTLGLFSDALVVDSNLQKVVVVVTLVAGTSLLIWIGDLISEKGIGNGISLIIFVGIISRLPGSLINIFKLIRIGELGIIQV